VVHGLFPFSLRGVEYRCDRLLAVSMVSCDVKELPRGSGHAAPESMHEGGAGRAVPER
jgi:hypothetical protein